MVKHKLAYAAAAFVMMLGTWAPSAFAYQQGGIISEDDEIVKGELYIEAGQSGNLDDIGIAVPDADSVESKTVGDVIDNMEDDCSSIYAGESVGRGQVICSYIDEDGDTIQTIEVTVHVYIDPNNSDIVEYAYLREGRSIKLIDYLPDYFDNPEEIFVRLWEGGESVDAVTLSGSTVADTVVTAKSCEEDCAGSLLLRNRFAQADRDEIREEDEDSDINNAMAYLDIYVYNTPELEDLTLSAYGTENKSVKFVIEDEGNLPPYSVASGNESIVKVEEDEDDGFILTAVKPGEAVMTVTYDDIDRSTQSFKVTVKGVDVDIEADEEMDDATEAAAVRADARAVVDAIIAGGEDIKDVEGFEFADGVKASDIINAVVAGHTLTTDMLATPVDESEVEDKEKTAINEELPDAAVLAGYLNIKVALVDEVTGQILGYLTELSNDVTITVDIPEDLAELEEGFARNYLAVRYHGGKAATLSVTDNNDGTASFKTGKFSTYALAYVDTENTENDSTDTNAAEAPQTGVMTGEGSSASAARLAAAVAVGLATTAFGLTVVFKRARKQF